MHVSAIVPARNEEVVIAACVESLVPQPEISEIIVVNDQSTDGTAAVVRQLTAKYSHVRLLETTELPPGWVGKNHAVWLGAQQAQGEWLLFTDADAVHAQYSAAKALAIAKEQNAALVSFSPEQVMETWYEKALIPYVYCRLARQFSYADVTDPENEVAAANGQFILIRRDVYQSLGGHAAIATEVLEDVALAERVKQAGHRIWFGSGQGIVRVRMYRSFRAMWSGWRKNLYQLMGASQSALHREMFTAIAEVLPTLLAGVAFWVLTKSVFFELAVLAAGSIGITARSQSELAANGYPRSLAWYAPPGRLLFLGVLWASYRGHKRGKLEWKGREYPVGTPGASKG
jgi:cellulose synthase/poly-beta-1,6-N-acetylglucosamine synthase-like glycosyltransferase